MDWGLLWKVGWGWLIGGATVVLGAARFFNVVGHAVSVLKKLKERMFGHAEYRAQLDQVAKQVQLIAHELTPNNGTSLRDAINRIEIRQMFTDERFKAVAADASEGILEFNVQGQLVWCNRTYLHLVGRDFSEVVGYGWINTIQFDQRDKVKEDWSEAVSQGRDCELKYDVLTPAGATIQVLIRATVMRSQNAVIGFLAVLTQTPVQK